MMVRPASFGFNPQTASSNVFQQKLQDTETGWQEEFERMVDLIRAHEIDVRVFEDTKASIKPDAIFPNNWISLHRDGTVVLYPMMAENRRSERRQDIVEALGRDYFVKKVIDLSGEELQGNYLEGTGSIVFDHVNSLAYACRSPRTSESLLKHLCSLINFKPVIFDAVDEANRPIYHTNVMMCVGEKFVIICLDSIRDEDQQEILLDHFNQTNHKVIAISYDQMKAFAGNMMEVVSVNHEQVVLLSQTAFHSLLPGQINAITQFAELLPLSVSTIEKIGGGSVRCMVAGIHLPRLKLD
jgi:hypothetical protein